VAGLSTKHDFSLTSPPNDALERTEAALLRTLLFLQGEASVVHQQLLPYRMPLIVLARLFDQHPQVSPRNRQLLVRWFWRGALTGEHGNSSQGAVAAHLGDIGEDPDDSVQRLLRRQKPVGGEEAWPAVDFSKTWHARSAASRMAAVLLLQQGPRAPQSETTWNMDDARSWLGQHVLSRSFVRADGGEGASAIAGRVASLGEASSLPMPLPKCSSVTSSPRGQPRPFVRAISVPLKRSEPSPWATRLRPLPNVGSIRARTATARRSSRCCVRHALPGSRSR
ncbi:MAG: hypothetical protein AAGA56_14540, partial [Myxococcota bacterium]